METRRQNGARTGAGVPDVVIGAPDLTCYDRLLGSLAAELAP